MKGKWSIGDEAIHRGNNYASANLEFVTMLRQDEGMTLHAVLKQAYTEGFLHGFAHKFDEHNYEEQNGNTL
jgi:hypothetical protein